MNRERKCTRIEVRLRLNSDMELLTSSRIMGAKLSGNECSGEAKVSSAKRQKKNVNQVHFENLTTEDQARIKREVRKPMPPHREGD